MEKISLKEAFAILDKESFNISYNVYTENWQLVIFDDDFEITYEGENNEHLADALGKYLNVEVDIPKDKEFIN